MSEVPERTALDRDEFERLEVIARSRDLSVEELAVEYISDGAAREFLRDQRASEGRGIH